MLAAGAVAAALFAGCASVESTSPEATNSSRELRDDKDCADFATRDEAQAFFVQEGGPGRDPHALDKDGNGQACETLPKATPAPPAP